MSELLQQFHFLRPWWLAALLALPLLGWLGMRRNVAQLELSRLVDAELLPHLLQGRAANRSLPVWLFALGWMLAALALAGPTWSRVEQPLYASRAAQVVAISLSQHMLARDVAPSRLDRARYKARDLLASNRDGLNALIGYAGEAFPPVRELAFELGLGELFALPDRVVGVLHGQRRHVRGPAEPDRLVGRPEFALQHSGRPFVEHRVVHDHAQHVVVRAEAQQPRPEQGPGGEVDPDAWTHGSSEQRMQAFKSGYESGQMSSCDTLNRGVYKS